MTARKSRQVRGRARASRLVLAALVLLALAGLYGLAGLSRPMALTAAPQPVPMGTIPVTSALVACPAPGSGDATGGGIALASAPAETGSGRLLLTALAATASAPSPASVSTAVQPGQLTVKNVKNAPVPGKNSATMPAMAGGLVPTSRARGGLVIAASGADAQGLDVEQLGPGGLPTARCQQPGSDFWFVGPASAKVHTELYLVNPDSTSADANLAVQTDSGQLLTTPDSGIVVPPHGMVVQNLDKLLHAAKSIALHVTTSTGRVVAAVRQTSSDSKPGSWLPAAQEPGTTQVLAGLPGTAGTRELYITVPGGAAARVKVTAITPRGSYLPTGGSGISLLGHLTAGIALPSLAGTPGSIEITSNVPVVAELEISGGPPGAPGAFISGSDAIIEQGVVAASPAGSAGTTELVLSAPSRAASVKITQAVPGAPLTGQPGTIVQIKAKSSTEVKISLPKHSKASVVALLVTPQAGSGPVYAARVAASGGTVLTILPVVPSPTRIDLNSVRASLVTVLESAGS